MGSDLFSEGFHGSITKNFPGYVQGYLAHFLQGSKDFHWE